MMILPRLFNLPKQLVAAALVTLTLAACSDGGEAGVGSGGSGIGPVSSATGTVTGFGSIIVDGERWDDRDAQTVTEFDPRQAVQSAVVKLGQRVTVDYQTQGSAERILIEAQVIGRVSNINALAAPSTLKVAGQTIKINSDANVGPVTVFEGFNTIADLQLNDIVQVYGASRFDTTANFYVIQATRIERRTTLPAGLIRIAGVIENYDSSIRRFRLGELTVSLTIGVNVVPANRALANGQSVVVWGADAVTSNDELPANFVRIRERSTDSSGAERTQLAGPLSRLDTNNLSFEVAGVRVDARSATIVPANQALAEGRYVIVRGTVNNNGVLLAQQVRIRGRNNGDADVELHGSITDYNSISDFKVRGIRVDASNVTNLQGCPAVLENGLYVELEGTVNSPNPTAGVTATRLKCENNPQASAVRTFDGLASGVNQISRSFNLSSGNSSNRTVQWRTNTFFDEVDIAELEGAQVQVDGIIAGTTVLATRIKRR